MGMEANMTTERVKIVTYITSEADKKIEAYMKRMGLTKSKTCSLAIQLGIDAMSISFDPDWKAYFEAQMTASNE